MNGAMGGRSYEHYHDDLVELQSALDEAQEAGKRCLANADGGEEMASMENDVIDPCKEALDRVEDVMRRGLGAANADDSTKAKIAADARSALRDGREVLDTAEPTLEHFAYLDVDSNQGDDDED